MNKSKVKSKATPDEPAWWLKPLAEPQAELATDAAGLSSAEARSRLAKFGPNLFRDHQERSLFLQFLSRFKNPLVILLLAASAISAFTGEMTNFVIITVMVLFSVTLDFVQEHRAGKAAESLRHSVSVRARVIRDGKPSEVPVTEVVPGDLAVLSAGDMVPADGLVLEAHDLFVKQALLTGESYPVEKHPGMPAADATDLQEATNAVFMGTTVISGSARMRVVKTGTGTAIGAIADSLNRQPPATAFEIGTHRFGLLIMRLTVLLVLFVLLVNALHAQALAGILPVCRGARGGADTGTAADGGVGHLVTGRTAHGEETGDRQAFGLYPEPGVNGCPVYGQDRHADRGKDTAGAACGPARKTQRTGAGTRLSQQLLRDRPKESARRCDPGPRKHRRERLEEDRRSPVRL